MISKQITGTILLVTMMLWSSPHPLRNGYGTSPTGAWSRLTPFEERAITHAEKAENSDGDALLALALIGSGDIRTEKQYDEIRAKVHQFNRKVQKSIDTKATQRAQAEHIYMEMLKKFFDYDGSPNRLLGYQLQQSKLSTVFATKKYNCISSAMLYLILLSYADIPCQGVLVPSHVFVQINTNEGESIEVETTSKKGFDFKHTKESVEDKSRSWYIRRGLEYYDWEAYQNRRFVSPFFTILRNYSNQHTASSKMSFEDQMRLTEIAHLCYQKSTTALQRRVSLYLNESNHVNRDTTGAIAGSFYRTISSFLDTLPMTSLDDTIQLYAHLIKLNKIIGLIPTISVDSTASNLLTYLRDLPPSFHDNRAIYQNTFFVTTTVSKSMQRLHKTAELDSFFIEIKKLYPKLSQESGDLEQVQYALKIREITESVLNAPLSQAVSQYCTLLQELPAKLQSNRLIQNNSIHLLSQFYEKCHSTLDAQTLQKLLDTTDKYYPDLYRETEKIRPFVSHFRVEKCIKSAKEGYISEAKKLYLSLLPTLSRTDKEDKTITHNLSFFLYYLTIHDTTSHTPTLSQLLQLTEESIPALKKMVHSIRNAMLHRELLSLIDRIPEDRQTLLNDINEFVTHLPRQNPPKKTIINNLTYLYQKLSVSGDTSGLSTLQQTLCLRFPNHCSDFSPNVITDHKVRKIIVSIDTSIQKEELSKAVELYQNLIDTLRIDSDNKVLHQNLLYITERVTAALLPQNNLNLLDLIQEIKEKQPALHAVTLPVKAQFHFLEGNRYWNRKEWKSAAHHYTEAIPLTTEQANRKALLLNIDGAYYNWAIGELNNSNKTDALLIVKQGLSINPEGKHCRKLLEKIELH